MDTNEKALVADCAHAGLTQIPKSLPNDTDWLNISGNNISSLQTEDLEPLNALSRLDLRDNRIRYITESFVEYLNTHSTIVSLDISDNELRFIPRKFESTKFLKTLTLSGNRFECQCNNIWMKNWLIVSREMVQDFNTVDCQVESGTRIPFIQVTDAQLTCTSMSTSIKILRSNS